MGAKDVSLHKKIIVEVKSSKEEKKTDFVNVAAKIWARICSEK